MLRICGPSKATSNACQMPLPRNAVIRCIRTIMKKPSWAGPNQRYIGRTTEVPPWVWRRWMQLRDQIIRWALYRDNAIPFFRESTNITAKLENNIPRGWVRAETPDKDRTGVDG